MEILFDKNSLKLGIDNYMKSAGLLDEACALGLEHVKITGTCNDVNIHVYTHVATYSNNQFKCEVAVLGVVVELLKTRELNNEVLSLFRYSNTIIEGDSTVLFYVDPSYTLGVFYMICKHGEVKWIMHNYVELEDLEYFHRGMRSW